MIEIRKYEKKDKNEAINTNVKAMYFIGFLLKLLSLNQ